METVKRLYRVDRREIHYIKFIFEACEGVALLSTIKGPEGIVALFVAPGCEEDADFIINGLKDEVMIEPILDKDI